MSWSSVRFPDSLVWDEVRQRATVGAGYSDYQAFMKGAPDAPHAPDEGRRCLMKPLRGNWPRAASPKGQIHKVIAINDLHQIIFEKVPKRRQKAARRGAAKSQVR
jgi:hypothetical protein